VTTASEGGAICVAGNLTLDDTFTDHESFPAAAGGDALYAALGARWWGASVRIVSRVGADYPPPHVEGMREAGIDVSGLRQMPGPTVHYRVDYRSQDDRIFEHLTDPARLDELSPQGEELSVIDAASWVHAAAMPIERQAEVIERARAHGIPYSLDPHEEYITGYESQLTELIDGSVFLPSELETALLFPGASTEEAVKRCLLAGVRSIAIKRGSRGCVVAAGGSIWRMPAIPVDAVDPTGAGDAYCGGFVAGLVRTGSALAAAACGTVSAARMVRGFGAFHSAPPDPGWVDESLRMLLQGRFDGEGDRVLTLLRDVREGLVTPPSST
jgi:sugar/nucleoside kinase (ribokinase family)